jgi:hypothetical protein
MTKEKAEAAVAKVFNVDPETIGTWEDRLSETETFGAIKVKMFKAAARKRGSDVKDADKNLFHGVDVSPWIQRYGDDTMREIAKQRKKRKSPKKR